MEPDFADLRLSGSGLYWVKDTIEMRYTGIKDILWKRELKCRLQKASVRTMSLKRPSPTIFVCFGGRFMTDWNHGDQITPTKGDLEQSELVSLVSPSQLPSAIWCMWHWDSLHL
ncbi:hypothetical protein N657DRAFT_713647 [Parathielavia appendiculata]|uniref:Uncharacterized protein n=1 Tax=Parathielavia appendiculata TaxID=2587402 RepID=A0AAN6TR97_9PEZI|nr:hypothetical protein N657DRAFT_713647 [Parathielavia appendiculata]